MSDREMMAAIDEARLAPIERLMLADLRAHGDPLCDGCRRLLRALWRRANGD